MRVKNRKCIRRLSFKSLWASRKRNIIAICAIALTTLMFTSLFTIMLSVNSSYETYNFRQAEVAIAMAALRIYQENRLIK